ncbi:histidine kinase [Streptomyces sp. NPDC051940]|uniref:sensor histidine kinase n=1 Tax=Streptomyces sp. NPDC051940 TaxID=3155675 RepID=UPI00343873FA
MSTESPEDAEAPRRRRPHRDDLVIAGVGFAAGALSIALGLYNNTAGGRDSGALLLLPLGAMAVAEVLRRCGQPWALVLAVAALAGDIALGSLLATIIMFSDVVYAAVLYGSRRLNRTVMVGSWLFTLGVLVGTLAAFRDPQALLLGAAAGAVTLTPAWTGQLMRAHRERADTERLRAEQTALLAELDRREAVAAERARMARELHDMVANNLSAIAIHSTAALSLDDPATSREALGVIRENSVQGLAEMRRLIGLLRDSSGDSEPSAAPTLAGVGALVDQTRANGEASGLTVAYTDGRPPGLRLPPPVELAAYRIVQESLTNALKHAAPGEVAVRLGVSDDGALVVRVTSPLGDREDEAPRAPGSGAGLVGMRERVGLLGGTLSAGPEATADGKVWQVAAVLPVDEEGMPG